MGNGFFLSTPQPTDGLIWLLFIQTERPIDRYAIEGKLCKHRDCSDLITIFRFGWMTIILWEDAYG